MEKLCLFIIFLLQGVFCYAQTDSYISIDTKSPIFFGGDYIVYNGKHIQLGPNSFFIDGELSNEEVANYPYVFNSVNEAVKKLTDGSEVSPMVLYIAPYVYWIYDPDDPDDPAVRIPKTGDTPFGLEIKCEWLKFCGLSDDPKNVVLACNRGQTMGAKGNFTMLNISGEGTCAENVTFGNYCNIDLEYPLKPELGRKRRGSAIVQAQLVFCDGDKLVARNTRFVSRLNLGPFWGGKRILFDGCHFESTDDALNGTAVYLNCSLDFYSSKPFGGTSGTGAVFLNCNIKSFTRGEQYFTKGGGQVAAIDTRFETETANYLGWRDFPDKESRNYQYNVSLNGKPVSIGLHHSASTVDLTGKDLLNAYRFVYNGDVIYNTYNLLRGDDDWDPMGIKEIVLSAGEKDGKSYINMPVRMCVSPSKDTIEVGKNSVILTTRVDRFGNYESENEPVKWTIAPEYESLVNIKIKDDGSCEVIPTNMNDDIKDVIVNATTTSGLEAATLLYVSPTFFNPPAFISLPKLKKSKDGKLFVDYKIDTNFEDQSLVSWYRCSDNKGSNPVEISVSHFNTPKLGYILSQGDIGSFVMATVSPKHIRCNAGESVSVITNQPIMAKDVKSEKNVVVADLMNMSTKYQPLVKPGYWTLDCYAPADTHEQNWIADNSKDPWYYGNGENGAANSLGLVQANKGARLRYTPVGDSFGDMKISFTAVPAKTAGQGFSSATDQYMDVCIKFDTESLTGYALRLVRTTKYHDAIDFVLMRYEKGSAVVICEPVSASCYRPDCHITVEVVGNKLKVHAENPSDYYTSSDQSGVVKIVDMESEIIPNKFGGIGFQHTGTVKGGATLIKDLKIEWK